MRIAVVAVFLLFIAQPLLAQGVPMYSVTQIGNTVAGTPAYPGGLNNLGQTTFYETPINQDYRAYFWDPNLGSTPITSPPAGIGSVTPRAVNDSGLVVGNNVSTAFEGAFLWNASTGMSSLANHTDGTFGWAHAINNAGQAVGRDSGPQGNYRALLWNPGSTPLSLGILPGLGNSSEALSINAQGNVVGWSGSVGTEHAFQWSSTNGMVSLGNLPGDSFSIASKINNFGVAVGRSVLSRATAVRWVPGSGIQSLGTIGSDTQSVAFGINDGGEVVGMSGISTFRAMRWTSTDGMIDLNTRLVSTDGWFLERAFEINQLGQIVGIGTHNGQARSFLLTPLVAVPEPTTWTLLGCGMAGVWGCWWYRRTQRGVELEREV